MLLLLSTPSALYLVLTLPPLMRRRPKAPVFLFALLFALTTLSCLSYYHLTLRFSSLKVSNWSSSTVLGFGEINTKMASPTSYSLSKSMGDKKKALLDRLSQPRNDASPFVIIMGNEAGDTDSLASSVLLCHLLSSSTSNTSSQFPSSTTFVPLAQLPKADLMLRAENEMLLSVMRVDTSDVLFLDDLPERDKLLRSDIMLGITDHPQLSTLWQPYDKFAEKVQVVVDHHADAKAHTNAKVRVIKGPENGAVGSAVSVVVNLFKDAEEMQKLPSQLADLGLAAILIDTDDLRPTPQGKATKIDIEAAQILLKQSSFHSDTRSAFIDAVIQSGGEVAAKAAKGSPEEADEIQASEVDSSKALQSASAYYRILTALKSDVSRLSTTDLLRRDYKEQTVHLSQGNSTDLKAGFSSVPLGLSEWIHERHGDGEDRWFEYWQLLNDWVKARNLDVAVVGTSFRDDSSKDKKGNHVRELILAYKQPNSSVSLFPSLVKYLESETYAAENGNQANLYLQLDQPWKGTRRVEQTGKKERLEGLSKNGSWTGDKDMKVAVWLQRNGRASRKVYLPAIVQALKMAAKGK